MILRTKLSSPLACIRPIIAIAGLLICSGVAAAQVSYEVLHSFTGGATDGANPIGSLIQGQDGTLYGTTAGGGTSDVGTIFQAAPDGSGLAVLHTFTGGADGANPGAGLIQTSDGTLYGTTIFGGDQACPHFHGCGAIFQMTPDGSTYAVLHAFTRLSTEGGLPRGALLLALDGSLYGTTNVGSGSNKGVVFRISTIP